MFRPVFTSLLAALLLVAAGAAQSDKKSAFNKAELETYVRHLWVIPSTMGVTIGDPTPSDVPGMQEVRVKITQGQASQEVPLYVTKDGGKILQGTAYDVNFNPFKKDLDKLKTTFQPSLGTPGATVVVVLFSDFQCPYCKVEESGLDLPHPGAPVLHRFPAGTVAPMGQARGHRRALRLPSGPRVFLGLLRLDLWPPGDHYCR